MITDRSRRYQYTLFGSLYFVQGIIVAFTSNFFKPYLDSFGVDPDRIALLSSLLLVPFIIKIFYGIFSDRINLLGRGHRLPYIVLALILSGTGILLAGFVNPVTSFALLGVMILLAAFSVALFDTTADALAVEITPLEQQGTLQSVMTSGRAIGIVVMSLLIGLVASALGFVWVFIMIGVLMVVPLVWVLPVREPPRHEIAAPFEWGAFKAILRAPYPAFALYGILAWTGFQAIEGLVTFFLSSELGGTELNIGTYGSIKGIGMIVGAFIIAFMIKRIGRKSTAYLVLLSVSAGGYLFSLQTTVSGVLTMGLAWGIIVGLHWTMYMIMAMNRVDPRIAGSMFAMSMMLSNIGAAAGEFFGTSLVDDIGFAAVFRLLAAGNLVVIPVLWILFKRIERFKITPQIA